MRGLDLDPAPLTERAPEAPAPVEPPPVPAAAAPPPDATEPPSAAVESAPASPVARFRSRRLRLGLAAAAVLGLIGVLIVVPQQIATSGAYVGFEGRRLAVYRGSPDGFLWADAEVERVTTIPREDVEEHRLDALDEGLEFDSLDGAEGFMATLRSEAAVIQEEREQQERREQARAQLDEFDFVRTGSCEEGEPFEGGILELRCERGEYAAWLTVWEDSAAMDYFTTEIIESQGEARSRTWSYGDNVTQGTLVTYVFDGDNRIYWTYDDTLVSVEGRHFGNDATTLYQLWYDGIVSPDE
jgi:hypothetical protein